MSKLLLTFFQYYMINTFNINDDYLITFIYQNKRDCLNHYFIQFSIKPRLSSKYFLALQKI